MMYRDRWGKKLTLEEWIALREDRSYCTIGSDKLGDDFISTMWLGCFGFQFETFIVIKNEGKFHHHWPTEKQALIAHAAMVEAIKAKINIQIAHASVCLSASRAMQN